MAKKTTSCRLFYYLNMCLPLLSIQAGALDLIADLSALSSQIKHPAKQRKCKLSYICHINSLQYGHKA